MTKKKKPTVSTEIVVSRHIKSHALPHFITGEIYMKKLSMYIDAFVSVLIQQIICQQKMLITHYYNIFICAFIST